ncbi:MAG: hypothetical protein IRZ24_13700 [Thermogemmatispora sp.]|uniref:hypothetical protein n=1 Tax=Thermogemmatispora sp. TaxID=1968838 RepID=UPI001D6EAA24|nr:hypothetical protein [Thermogemmatispora sp.]MBX5451118.1 hypothetical protein [Thermogemmatispora sp.]
MTVQEALSVGSEARYEDHSRWWTIAAIVRRQAGSYTARISRQEQDCHSESFVQAASLAVLERVLKQTGVDPHVGWRPVSGQ